MGKLEKYCDNKAEVFITKKSYKVIYITLKK